MKKAYGITGKGNLILRIKNDRFLYLLVIPGMIYFLIFCYLPMYGVVIGFKDYFPSMGLEGVFTSKWVGFAHLEKFIGSPYFSTVMLNTVIISLLKLIFGFPAPILLALMLNEIKSLAFKKITQTISYLPYFISWVIVGGLIVSLLSVNRGPVNELIKAMGMEPVRFIGNEKYFRSLIVISDIWKNVGWGSIIYLAGIVNINPELYEASICDGANKLRQIWHITLPGIMNMITIMLIFAVGGLLNAGFEQILLLYDPSVYSVGDIIDTYVYRVGLMSGEFAYGTAVNLFKSVLSLILILGANYAARKFDQEGIW